MRCLILFTALSLLTFASAFGQVTKEVTFRSDTLELHGTLTLPKGEGPFHGMVFVHGSGPNNRDQKIVLRNSRSQCLYPNLHGDTLQNFKELADTLSRHGIATLRYDKRTFTHRTALNLKTLNPRDFINDIHAALDFLKKQPKVKDDRLLLLGHSQGGNFIPLVARERNDVAGLIALATPAESIDTVLANQIRYFYERCVDSIQAIIKSEKILHDFNRLRKGHWPKNKPIMNAYPDFWKNWLAITDSTIRDFRQVKMPTLFIAGSMDYNVPSRNLYRFLDEIKRTNARFKLLEGVNHFMATMNNPHLSPKVAAAIIQWLDQNGVTVE